MIDFIQSLHHISNFAAGLVPGDSCSKDQAGAGSFFTIPHWWEYISKDNFHADALGQCQPDLNNIKDIFPVGLAILDIMLRLVGFMAVIMIISSGINYIIAQGNPDKAANARKMIYYALIGLGIAFTAALFVAFIGNSLGGGT